MPTLTSPTTFTDTFTRLMHSPSSPNTHAQENTSDLLRSIRAALDRTTSEPTPVHSSSSILSTSSTSSNSTNTQGLHETLSWDSSRVALSYGGSISRQWSFDRDGQPVQWACRAWLDGGITLSPDTRRKEDGYEDGEEERRLRTFGPFSRARARGSAEGGLGGGGGGGKERDRALIVFLRSIGHAYTDEGTPYTFSLPFTVRRAFALYPTGILIQRALEPSESHEEEDEEEMLPTVFSLKSVRQEMSVVGGWMVPRRGVVLDVVERNKEKDVPVLVVLDPESLKIFICVYREASSHQPSTHNTDVPGDRKRKSTARRSSLGGADRHTSTTSPSLPAPPAPTNPSLVALPNMPPSLAPSLTLASLVALPTSGPPPTNSAGFPPAFPSSEQRIGHGHGHTRTESTGLSAGVGRLALDTDVFGSGPHNALNLNTARFPDSTPNALNLGPAPNALNLGAGPSAFNTRRASPMPGSAPVPAREHTKMRATHELVKIAEFGVNAEDAKDPDSIQIAVFDARHDGIRERSLLGICLPRSSKLSVFSLSQSPSPSTHSKEKEREKEWTAEHVVDLRANSCAAVTATREGVMDLVYSVPPEDTAEEEGRGGEMVLLTHGLSKIRLSISGDRVHILDPPPSPSPSEANAMDIDRDSDHNNARGGKGWRILSSSPSSAHIVLVDPHGHRKSLCLDYTTRDVLVTQSLMVLALSLPATAFFDLHHSFLYRWDSVNRAPDRAYGCFEEALSAFFGLGFGGEKGKEEDEGEKEESAWTKLARSGASSRFKEDDVLRNLTQPTLRPSQPQPQPTQQPPTSPISPDRTSLRAPVLNALHHLAEDLRLLVPRAPDLARLAPLIVRLARRVRPEWGEYWVRLVPGAAVEGGNWTGQEGGGDGGEGWEADDRLPIWPPDLMSGMLARLSSTTSSSTSTTSTSTVPPSTSKGKWYDASRLSSPFASSQPQVQPSFAFGRVEPLGALRALSAVFRALCESSSPPPSNSSIPQSTSVSCSFTDDDPDDPDAEDMSIGVGGSGGGVGDENVRAAHAAIRVLVRMRLGREFVERLRVPVGCVVREAARTYVSLYLPHPPSPPSPRPNRAD
ncbi:hypothetical protein PENSPDRAFT_355001 [Peniophora sp. CONT]|nr:hypothetical protein PENSPDRAFT_355001 [Peniophora sp. CONT]